MNTAFYVPAIAVAGGASCVLLCLPGMLDTAVRTLAWVFYGTLAVVFALYCVAFFLLYLAAILFGLWVCRWAIVTLVGFILLTERDEL